MKFNIGDLVVLKHTKECYGGSNSMKIFDYSKNNKKYVCLSFDYYDCSPDCILIVPKNIIEIANEKNIYHSSEDLKLMQEYPISSKFDLFKFPVGEYDENMNYKQIKAGSLTFK